MTIQDSLFDAADSGAYPGHVLSWGLGADSTAILLRWLYEPASRDFALDDLLVITAHTGDEYPSTLRDSEEVVLPALRAHGVRLVQVGRNRRNTTAAGDGITVFSDTSAPERLYANDGYALSDEHLGSATLPQLASRRCSARAKGAALDPVIARLTARLPYRHYLGFETGEIRRAQRDSAYNTAVRQGVYPLLVWDWSRTDVLSYLRSVTGREWQKSACVQCPFQFSSKAGFAAAMERYRREPESGARALYLEAVSVCFNPKQGLLAAGRLIDAVRAAELTEVLQLFETRIAASEHGLYEVRRVSQARSGGAPLIARCVRQLGRGSATELGAALLQQAGDIVTGADGITRVIRRHRGTEVPWAEHFYVVAPSSAVADKARAGFEAMFASVTHPNLTLI